MEVFYSTKFQKQYSKLPKPQQEQFRERLRLFLSNSRDPRLRLHPLKGSYFGYWSININGDIRALFKQSGNTVIIFMLIGSHSELYG